LTSAGATRVTYSTEETERLGAELAAALRPGDVVLVSGELGAGKTTLVRGACRALGVEVPVTSPTFTIGQRYPAGGPVATVSHLDLYRVARLEDEDPDLLADYVGPDTISFIEWPEGAEPVLDGIATIARRVRLSHAGGDRRTVELE
jgi:tRNA threonylcarbamoyladenosine biosynthesis protein TsaE